MTTDQLLNIALALITPLVTAAIGVVGLVANDWHQRRTQAGRRKLALEDASRQVAFASELWNAGKLIAESPEADRHASARAWTLLQDAADMVEQSAPAAAEERPGVTLPRLLLSYPLHSSAARFFRGAFYLFLGLVPLWVGAAIHSTVDPGRLGVTSYLFGEHFYVDVAAILAVTVLAMVLRSCAIQAERTGTAAQDRPRSSTRRALLLYPFASARGKAVRTLFHVWLVVLIVLTVVSASHAVHQPASLLGASVQFVGLIGYALALRYWAASLEAPSR